MNLDSFENTAASSLPQPRKRGRPPSGSPEKLAVICDLVRRLGWSDSAAGKAAGLTRCALSRWKRRDEEVALAIGQARAQFVLPRLQVLASATLKNGEPDWWAEVWRLKYSAPEVYGRPSRRRRLAKVQVGLEISCADVTRCPENPPVRADRVGDAEELPRSVTFCCEIPSARAETSIDQQ